MVILPKIGRPLRDEAPAASQIGLKVTPAIVTSSPMSAASRAPGLERLNRDVLSHHGVTHIILFMGTNDIRREAPAAQVIEAMQEIIKRVRARGMKIIGVTIIPRHNRPPAENNTGWNAAKTQVRNKVNRWMRTSKPFDALIDLDAAVRDPDSADLIYEPFNCGDGIHPSPRGYFEMGRPVPLDLFR